MIRPIPGHDADAALDVAPVPVSVPPQTRTSPRFGGGSGSRFGGPRIPNPNLPGVRARFGFEVRGGRGVAKGANRNTNRYSHDGVTLKRIVDLVMTAWGVDLQPAWAFSTVGFSCGLFCSSITGGDANRKGFR